MTTTSNPKYNDYTFSMEEVVSRKWTLTLQAPTPEEAFAMAEFFMRDDIQKHARNHRPLPQQILSQRINGIFLPNPSPSDIDNS